ncbi:MAG: adenosylcobinamide-GDP ribazoletransferase [Chloroflexota bacterium]|nr:adenosylcobinamide-GDP ribazoletransferase [Chloroflexota bacterium]
MFNALLTALDFLTVIPLPHPRNFKAVPLGKATGWFPWVGALLGGLSGALYIGLRQVFAPWLAAALAAAAWIALTGGLHLDGLADCCDGLLYAGPRERRLEIMKDPHHGTFAGIGLTLAILLKVAALAALPATLETLGAAALAAALARWLLLPSARQPNARESGLGAAFSDSLDRKAYVLAIPPLLILPVWLGGRALVALLLAHGWAACVFRLAKKRLGGLTGDVYGLIVEGAELLVLLVFAAGRL